MRRFGALTLAVAGGLLAAGMAGDRLRGWVERTQLPSLTPEVSRVVLDQEGTLLRAYTVADGRWRLPVRAEEVDPAYIAALIAFEDKRFRRHNGVDGLAMVRAVTQSIGHGRVVSGGSTLTMQVARLLEDSGTGKLSGKLRQIRVAWALENRLSKDDILTLYLHLAPMGGNLEGVRAASLAYFAREPGRLTPAQIALLVALPQSPERRRPDRNPAAARTARDRVLVRIVGEGILSPDVSQSARLDPVPVDRADFPALAPHLADRLISESPGARVLRTSLSAPLQTRMEALVRDAVRPRSGVSAAIVVADHRTGEILASVGSPGLQEERGGFLDMTRALRSPGSTLKPFIYGMAFDEGLAHPETLIEDRPTRFGRYAPQNFDRQYHGPIRVRDALQSSRNVPAVAVLDALGPERFMTRLERAGVSPVLTGKPGLAVALGGLGLSLTDLVQLYATLANGGVARPLHIGATLPADRRMLSARAAWQVADILAGAAPPPHAPEGRLAYKTGTSYGYRDAWAVGFDGSHVIGVWMGRTDGASLPGVLARDTAAPVLFEAFGRLKPALDRLPPPPADTLLVPTGALPLPLRRFGPGEPLDKGPEIAFPPAGARVALDGLPLLARVEGGVAPYTWLADGVPVIVNARDSSAKIPARGPGFVNLSVIDATGMSARVSVRLD